MTKKLHRDIKSNNLPRQNETKNSSVQIEHQSSITLDNELLEFLKFKIGSLLNVNGVIIVANVFDPAV